MRIFLTGGTGMLGRRLTAHLLDRGDDVVVLTRDANRARGATDRRVVLVEGDPTKPGSWQDDLRSCDAAVNLAGEPTSTIRWDEEGKAKIRDSRCRSARNVADAVAAARRAMTLVSASAVRFYGPRDAAPVDESTGPGSDFQAGVAVAWEAACAPAADAGARVVNPRVGPVLHLGGGPVGNSLKRFNYYLGGTTGAGTHFMSWVHLADLARIFLFALDRPELRGPINACAPNPITWKEFSAALGRAVHRPSWLRLPSFAVRRALGEAADLLLTGQRVVPRRLLDAGFQFRFPSIDEALADVLGSGNAAS